MGRFMERGELGPRASQGGDGTAEYRYMESVDWSHAELVGTGGGDDAYVPPPSSRPITSPSPTRSFTPFSGSPTRRRRTFRPTRGAWRRRGCSSAPIELVDIRLEQMERLAASEPNTRLFVTGEHGMRPTSLVFKPNVVLSEAGLLATTSRAMSIFHGRPRCVDARSVGHRESPVAERRASRSAGGLRGRRARTRERALLAARDSAGTQIVTRVFRAGTVEGDSLGLGGPGGGDLYIGLAPGYYWDSTPTGASVASLNFPQGEHGYPSTDRDMHPLLCILGDGAGRRIGEVRSIDIAPTVTAWLGISAPAEARGRVLTP